MQTFAIDLRHLQSKKPTGKAIYTARLLELLLQENKVVGFTNRVSDEFNLKHKNLFIVKVPTPIFHIYVAIYCCLKQLQLVATESFITPTLTSLLGVKNLVVVHDLIAFQDKSHAFIPKILERIFLPLLTLFKGNSFSFSSEFHRKLAKKIFKFRTKNLFVFFPGQKIKPSRSFKIRKKYITFHSTFFERKNQLCLLQAFNSLKDEVDNTLVLVGKFQKPYITEIQNYILKNKLQERVLLMDYVSDKELTNIFNNTCILVNPSFNEGFGLPIIEALSKNIPCIISDIPVFKEIFKNSCLYFDPSDPSDLRDKILFLNRNIESQTQLLKNAKSVFKTYSFPKTLLKLKLILKKL